MRQQYHPNLYEINTRVWLNRFGKYGDISVLDVPEAYWKYLKEMGMDYIWLMGVWKTAEVEYDRTNITLEQKAQYLWDLPDFTINDLIGSPYAIDTYELNPSIGTESDFIEFRHRLNNVGLKLILDFVPNHFGKHSRHLQSNSQILMHGSEEDLINHPGLFFRSPFDSNKILAHGKDPYYGPWIDTVQIDYSRKETREFMKTQMNAISEICDGVRCDMAMMVLNNIFNVSWSQILPRFNNEMWENEFWLETISEIKKSCPEFIFIAESYWGTDNQLLSNGFDYTYDKSFTDHILSDDLKSIRTKFSNHKSQQNYQLRFLENHDEKRILSQMNHDKAWTAAAILAQSPGMKLYYYGQWEGKEKFTSVHLGRSQMEASCQCPFKSGFDFSDSEVFQLNYKSLLSSNDRCRYPIEVVCPCNYFFYNNLLKLVNRSTFKYGSWALLNIMTVEEYYSIDSILAMMWSYKDDIWITIHNYSSSHFQGIFNLAKPDKIIDPDHKVYWFDELNEEQISLTILDNSIIRTDFKMRPYSSRFLHLLEA